MDRLEAYILGTVGLLLALGSLLGQVLALAVGQMRSAILLTVGVVLGALPYRAGYRLLSR
ncbi:MAG TPA: hypothetical protein VF129_14795 [Actinomycetota bacterium]